MKRIAFAVPLLAASLPALGQAVDPVCMVDGQPRTPASFLGTAAAAEQASTNGPVARKADDAEKATADLPTSPNISGASTASTIADFLPLFSLAGLSGNMVGPQDGATTNDDALAFDFNIPLSSAERQLKLQASFDRSPTLLEGLVQAVPAADRDAFRQAQEKELTISDDASFSIIYNIANENVGRTRESVSLFFDAAIASVSAEEFQRTFAAASELVSTIRTATPEQVPVLCAQLIAATGAFGVASRALDAAENRVVRDARIDDLAKLINNQPQLYAGVTYRDRNPLVGPSEKSVKITYEWGYRGNVNSLEKHVVSYCERNATADCRLEGYVDYVTAEADAIASGDRLKFSLEYADVDDLSVALQQPALLFSKAGSKKLVSSVAYGRSLTADNGLFNDARIDIEVKREDVDDDPARNNRTIGTVTLTRTIGEVSFPFSIVYANKPEFLTPLVDDKISAHIGIKYDFDDKN